MQCCLRKDCFEKARIIISISNLSFFVEDWILCSGSVHTDPLKKSDSNWWDGGEEHVVCTDGPTFKQDLTCPIIVGCIVQLVKVKDNVLVERVQDHIGNADVVPSSVDKEQPPQESERETAVIFWQYRQSASKVVEKMV